jgi:AhpD family alkylhydroperoxidase
MKNNGRRYTPAQCYTILYDAMRTIPYLKKAKKAGLLDEPFVERIMLAVTQVNGCAMCSYAHTKMALEKGMANEEIQNLLSGDLDHAPEEELPALMFAQHYAESKGHPSKPSWDRITENYGEQRALGILASTRIIMMGNAFGIVLGSFKNRLKGKPDEGSRLGYELSVLLLFVPFLLAVPFHRLFSAISGKPVISFPRPVVNGQPSPRPR